VVIFKSFKYNAFYNLAALEGRAENNAKVCKIDKFAHTMKNTAY